MSEMIERVARAMAWEAIIESLELSGVMAFNPEWIEKQVDEDWPMYRRHARAAIAAMREPTDAMLGAGYSVRADSDNLQAPAILPPQGEGG